MPSSRWRLTFSTTMIASSTTSPIASTSASRVSRLMEKPNISIMVKVPISDSGMAMTGISTDRGEPRNTNTTRVTISTASTSVRHHLVDRAGDEVGRVVDDRAGQAVRQLRLDAGKDVAHALDDVEQVGAGRHLDADIDRALAVEADLRIVVVVAERDVRHVLQPHDRAVTA